MLLSQIFARDPSKGHRAKIFISGIALITWTRQRWKPDVLFQSVL